MDKDFYPLTSKIYSEPLPDKEVPMVIGQEAWAYRIAAGMLAMSAILNFSTLFMGKGSFLNIGSTLVDIAIIIGLLALKSWARGFLLFRAVAGSVLSFFLTILGSSATGARADLFTILLMAVLYLGYGSSFVILLTGEAKTWRLVTGPAIFFIIFFVPRACLLGLVLVAANMNI